MRIVEPGAFGHEAIEQRQHAVGAIGEGAQDFMGIDA